MFYKNMIISALTFLMCFTNVCKYMVVREGMDVKGMEVKGTANWICTMLDSTEDFIFKKQMILKVLVPLWKNSK